MIGLARALHECHGIDVLFAVDGPAAGLDAVRNSGFMAVALEANTLGKLIASRGPEFLICDMRGGLSGDDFTRLSHGLALTAVIDDMSGRRLAADVAYYPPVPQAHHLGWSGSHCAPRIGWEWVLLGPAKVVPLRRSVSPRPTVLIAMGGADPHELTFRVARALAKLNPVFRARFVIDPTVPGGTRIARQIVRFAPHFETIEGACDLATEYAASDMAIATFGTTAYELAARGVPALYLCLADDDVWPAAALEQACMGISLGRIERAHDEDIAGAIWALLTDPPRRREMRNAGLATVDLDGAIRIADDLVLGLEANRVRPFLAAG